jgi:hypothetical protein
MKSIHECVCVLPSAERLLLIWLASVICIPSTLDLAVFSLPARSTKNSFDDITVVFVSASVFATLNMKME